MIFRGFPFKSENHCPFWLSFGLYLVLRGAPTSADVPRGATVAVYETGCEMAGDRPKSSLTGRQENPRRGETGEKRCAPAVRWSVPSVALLPPDLSPLRGASLQVSDLALELMRFSLADSSSGSIITWVALRRCDSYADLNVTAEHVSAGTRSKRKWKEAMNKWVFVPRVQGHRNVGCEQASKVASCLFINVIAYLVS